MSDNLKNALLFCAERLVQEAARVRDLPLVPEADDVAAMKASLIEVAGHMDRLILAYGNHAQEGLPSNIDIKMFQDNVIDAICGNATYELDCAQEQIEEDMREFAA